MTTNTDNERAQAARLEEAQRYAFYAECYRVLALYHTIHEHPPERGAACTRDAERCQRFVIAAIFGPMLELEQTP